MKLYNSLTREKDEFTVNGNTVRIYTCGPTVYHFAHIGNLRSYIMEDVLEKYIRYMGYDVKRVMNITDVGHLSGDSDDGEDKMLNGAKREKKTVAQIAEFYTNAFFEDCKKLNIRKPDTVVPATSCVPEFIDMIQVLLDKGYAYQSGGNIYFDTSKTENYYVFNKHDADDLEEGVREGVGVDDNKRNKTDFALWFTKSKFDSQELKWDSPWGVGYPGWHIECSAISLKYLGEYLDIHCGGIDNAFPHHTNEIAQSEAYLGHPWCRFWFHILHLNTNSGKMSKSKGEFLTVSLLEEKGYKPVWYRFFCLQSHYRKSLVFSYEGLDNAAVAYKKLVAKIAALSESDGELDTAACEHLNEIFNDALGNDINTSLAITAIYDVLKYKTNDATKLHMISEFDKVLSLDLIEEAKLLKEENDNSTSGSSAEEEEINMLVAQRTEAKKNKNYGLADEIRTILTSRGIILEDTPSGTKWRKA